MPERPSDIVARMRGAATGRATTPPAAPAAGAAKPAGRVKYTMLMSEQDSADLDAVVALLGRQLGRRRVDRSEALRGLVRLARRDLALLAQLAEELGGPAAP
jgi:hypothetical protein